MSGFRSAVVSLPGRERVARTPFGARIVIHATAAETGGAFGMWETFTPPGQGPAPHTHTRETEVFRVIRGLYRIRCGDDEFDAPPGTVVVLPPHVQHSWRNISDEPGQMFGTVTPGGCEQLFIDIEALNADTPEKIAVIEARLGIVNDATLALGLAIAKRE
ncbi:MULTISPECIES: cupin domain-containing protein [unclassified Rhizobium]|uniref:cupin domain-containing protein n=1 Tax=unclassified Rhizobium TaxID=2613769 RepID=UPI001611B339|nr:MULTISPECIES: cupin domain-containing protein [unclassified Rhizobium]MBB3314528.1 mannose-6-phosphate isomerase-like protein (cupin superfamily) [Rhizobium sp. BK181]MCS3739126.1 mannose-6-phosphate isomerase-like protein (cupin superfamily) [Rhizobium sp. BK661]MCS4090550.1 mannose-6-phosphate isomerase-like protein (cupin superfamily) [Rhizobium sp. BK176]